MRVFTAQQYTQWGRSENDFLILTHDGAFHADEVLAIAFLTIVFGPQLGVKPSVVRTREKAFLQGAIENPETYVIDVGGVLSPSNRNYDHHQDGTLPSAFGLVVDAHITEFIAQHFDANSPDDLAERTHFKIATFATQEDAVAFAKTI